MYNFVKKGALLLLTVGLAVNLASCDDDCGECNAPSVTPPTVSVAPNTLSGVIYSKDGNGIEGATVTLKDGVTTTTDAQGAYKFDNVAAGTYMVTVKANEQHFLPAQGQVVVTKTGSTQHVLWSSVLMPFKESTPVKLLPTAETEVENAIETDALAGNDKAEVQVDLVIPALEDLDGVDAAADVQMTVYPIYNATQAEQARSLVENTLLVGSVLTCNNPAAQLKAGKFVELTYNVDAALAQAVQVLKLVDGQWVAANHEVKNDQVIVKADAFTAYGLFLDVTFNENASTQLVEFDNTKWDNLYGAQSLEVKDVNFAYQSGTEVELNATNVLSALLVEKLAQRYGSKAVTLEGSHPVNITLPVGTKLFMSGSQQVKNVTASAKGEKANGKVFGAVSVKAETYNRDHFGGSN
ncbi:hypothetical protein, secreted [gut metagenome]|uniref:Uncharacterized protein n=1 Tax=gut metagenome TaxID=749906 RepID=J9G844_9ZZZZ